MKEETKTYKLMKLGVKNLNERIYTKEDVEPRIKELKEKMLDILLYGELGYPDTFDVSMSNASHVIEDLYIEDDFVYGRIKTLSIHKGTELQKRLDENSIVFRPRGSGTVREDGTVDLKQIFTFDAVDIENDSYKGLMD